MLDPAWKTNMAGGGVGQEARDGAKTSPKRPIRRALGQAKAQGFWPETALLL